MSVQLTRNLPHHWSCVREIRTEVTQALGAYPSGVRYAAMMTASELLENAVKYGDAVDAAPQIQFAMSANSRLIEIVVASGSRKKEQVQELERHVNEITGAQDRAATYFGRLRELVGQPSQSGKLGIYRIVFEGEFDLDVLYADDVVTVRAKRVVA
jgi:hypothetical protein